MLDGNPRRGGGPAPCGCLGVHVGEVELAGDDVRAMAVHEAAWVMAMAGRDEILVTEAVRPLCKGTDLVSEDAGEHDLKGVPDRWHLYRVQGVPSAGRTCIADTLRITPKATTAALPAVDGP